LQKCIFLGSGHSDQVDQVAWHWTNPDLLASASGDKSIRVWDLRQKKTQASLSTKCSFMFASAAFYMNLIAAQNINVVWSPCGNYIVYGDKDDKLHLVDVRVVKVEIAVSSVVYIVNILYGVKRKAEGIL
jgi:THO complex subunit 3